MRKMGEQLLRLNKQLLLTKKINEMKHIVLKYLIYIHLLLFVIRKLNKIASR